MNELLNLAEINLTLNCNSLMPSLANYVIIDKTFTAFTHQTIKYLFAVTQHVSESANQRHFQPAVREAHGQLLDPVHHIHHAFFGTRTVEMSESHGTGT